MNSIPKLNMSALYACSEIVDARKRYPSASIREAIALVRRSARGVYSLDYSTAEMWLEVLGDDLPTIRSGEDIQVWLSAWIAHYKPVWTRASLNGRHATRQLLDENEEQCLEAAGLFSSPPSPRVIQWWDDLAQEARSEREKALTAVGREAELLSLQLETQFLHNAAIDRTPIWVALDDNSAGYDIQSYRVVNGRVVPKLIEVKGTHQLPPTFHLTRNEWEVARIRSDSYCFQVWELAQQKMIELSVEELIEHIPEDRGRGRWQESVIRLRDWKRSLDCDSRSRN